MPEDPTAQPEPSELAAKQKWFVDAYVGDARFNKAEGARMAAYSEKCADCIGLDLYKTPHIRARIDGQLALPSLSAPESFSS